MPINQRSLKPEIVRQAPNDSGHHRGKVRVGGYAPVEYRNGTVSPFRERPVFQLKPRIVTRCSDGL